MVLLLKLEVGVAALSELDLTAPVNQSITVGFAIAQDLSYRYSSTVVQTSVA